MMDCNANFYHRLNHGSRPHYVLRNASMTCVLSNDGWSGGIGAPSSTLFCQASGDQPWAERAWRCAKKAIVLKSMLNYVRRPSEGILSGPTSMCMQHGCSHQELSCLHGVDQGVLTTLMLHIALGEYVMFVYHLPKWRSGYKNLW
jgi:hypothetical protein